MRRELKTHDFGGDGFQISTSIIINGIECNVLIDTGAGRTVLDKTFCKEFGFDLTPATRKAHSATGSAAMGEALINRVKINGHILTKKRHWGVMDLSTVSGYFLSRDNYYIVGIIGGDLLKELGAEINYKSMELKL